MSDPDARTDAPDGLLASAPVTTLEVEHAFTAAPGAVYRAFLDPGLFTDWYAPSGYRIVRDSVVIEPVVDGGQRGTLVRIDDPADERCFASRFVDLDEPHRIVAVEEVGRSVTQTLDIDVTPVQGGCRLCIRVRPYPVALVDEARAGWAASFAKLERALEARAHA